MGRHSRDPGSRTVPAPPLTDDTLTVPTSSSPQPGSGRNFWTEVLVLICGRAIAAVMSAAVFALAARHVFKEDFGRVTSLVSLGAICAIAIDAGMSTGMLRSGGIGSSDQQWFRRQVLARFVTGITALVVFLAADGLATTDESSLHRTVALAAFVATVACAAWIELFAVTAFIALRRSLLSVTIQLADRALSLGVLIAFGLSDRWYEGFLLSQIVGPAFCGVSLALGVLHAPAGALPRADLAARMRFLQGSLAVQAQNLEVPIVGGVSGSVQAAYIGLGSRLTGPLTLAANVGSNVILRSRDGTRDRTNRVTAVGLLACLPLLACASLPSGALAAIVGHGYASAVPVLRIVLIAAGLNCLLQPVAADLQRVGQQRVVARVISLGMLLGLTGCAVGALWAGAVGGACGMLASQTLQTVMFFRIHRRLAREKRVEVPS